MFFSGIADEAGKTIETQIKAHKQLGWDYIELRNVNGKQFADATDEEFEAICEKLAEANIKVSCFASALCNWARKITNPFEVDVEELKRCIPRMQKLGTQFIRTMSYPNDDLADDAWRDESVRRLKELCKMAEDGGITLALENCDGWASASAENLAKFIDLVGSPALKIVYDTGNAASHGHENTWDWYQAAKPNIAYIHIKAAKGPGEHVWPSEGKSMVKETLTDLFASGYDGGISIEPHMKAVVHEGKEMSDEEAAYNNYIEYGQRTMKIVEEARA